MIKKFKRPNLIEKLSLKTDLVQTPPNIYHFKQMKHNVTQWEVNCVWNRLLAKIS